MPRGSASASGGGTGARKTARTATKMTPAQARKLYDELRQEIGLLKDSMLDPIFIENVKSKNDPKLEKDIGEAVFDLILWREKLTNAILESILGEMRANERGIRAAIKDAKDARQNLQRVKKVLNAATKLVEIATKVLKLL